MKKIILILAILMILISFNVNAVEVFNQACITNITLEQSRDLFQALGDRVYLVTANDDNLGKHMNLFAKNMEDLTDDEVSDINITVDFIETNTLVTHSRTINISKNYSESFDNKTLLANKITHYAYIPNKDGLDMEKRIEYLEGFTYEMKRLIEKLREWKKTIDSTLTFLYGEIMDDRNRINQLEEKNRILKNELCNQNNLNLTFC